MKTSLHLFSQPALWLTTFLLISNSSLHAQSLWTNAAGGDWNTAVNWNPNVVPAEGTNAVIASSVTVTYNTPMTATSIGTLAVRAAGGLNVAASGFKVDTNGIVANGTPGIMVSAFGSTGSLNINSGGTVTVSNIVASALPANWGAVSISTNGILTVNSGGSLNISNTSGTLSLAVGFQGTTGNPGRHPGGSMVINGGSVSVDQNLIVACGNSSGSTASSLTLTNGGTLNVSGATRIVNATDDAATRIIISGGTANLGAVTVARTSPTGGFYLTNGVGNMSSLDFLTGPSRAFVYILGGTVTNSGAFLVGNRNNAATTGTRTGSYIQRGGDVYSTGSGGIIICNQGNTAAPGSLANILSILEITGGTLTAEQITLNNPTITANAAAQLIVGGTASVYLGAGGLVGNLPATSVYTVSLTGGTIAAKNSAFGIGADLTFSSGSTTIKAADAANTPYDITMTNAIAGSGTFVKTGGGKFTILGVGSHTGTISINEGTLALDGIGAIPTTSAIAVGSGATFDAGPAFTLNAAKTLRGTGTVTNNVTAAAGAFIKPADDAVIGTLTFTNNLIETGGAKNNFDITSPGAKDLLIVRGTLDISSGVQEVNVTALGTPPVGTYELIRYGTLVGNVTNNLTLLGAVGYLRTNATGTAIELVLTADRNATNLVWLGDSVLNNWEANATFNWTNNGSGAAFKFLPGDNVTFNNQGSISPAVNLVGGLQPSAVTANASVNYTLSGDGKITGLTGLTKTNSGRLTVLTANDYTGVTTLAGGTLSVSNLANGGTASGIGAALNPAANLVFNGGALEYLGETRSINRGATLQSGGGTVSVFDPVTALTISGNLTGAGLLTKTGDGQLNLSSANDYAGGTLVTAGSLRTPQGSGVNISALGTNTLTLNGTANPAAFVFGADQEVLTNLLTVTGNNNFITNNGNNTVVTMSGSGTLTLEGTGANVFTVEGNITAFSGTFYVNTLPNLRLFPSSGSSNAVFDLGTGSGFLNNRNGGITAYLGALIGGPSTQLREASSADNPSTYVIGGKNLSTTFDGQIVNGPSAPRNVNIVKAGTATLTLTGSSTHTGSTTISNGVLALSGTGSVDNSTNIVIVAPGVIDVSARGDTFLNVGFAAAQVLRGNGTNYGSLNVGSQGTVAPGFSIGTLYVTNTVTLGGNATMEVDRNGGSPLADKLVAPFIAYGGMLTIVNTGLPLQIGDTFDLFDGALSGTFATIAGGYYTWNTASLALNGTITVSGVLPTPSISSVAISGPDITFSSTNGAPFSPVIVLSSTNVALPMTNWTPVLTNAYDGVGYFNFTTPITSDPTERFFRLRVQ